MQEGKLKNRQHNNPVQRTTNQLCVAAKPSTVLIVMTNAPHDYTHTDRFLFPAHTPGGSIITSISNRITVCSPTAACNNRRRSIGSWSRADTLRDYSATSSTNCISVRYIRVQDDTLGCTGTPSSQGCVCVGRSTAVIRRPAETVRLQVLPMDYFAILQDIQAQGPLEPYTSNTTQL